MHRLPPNRAVIANSTAPTQCAGPNDKARSSAKDLAGERGRSPKVAKFLLRFRLSARAVRAIPSIRGIRFSLAVSFPQPFVRVGQKNLPVFARHAVLARANEVP